MGMDQDDDEDTRRRLSSLLAARTSLRAGVERSRALTHALARSGTKVAEIQARLQAASAAVRPIRAPRDALEGAGPNIDRAVGPAAAVLKVFDAVHGLEPPLLLSGAAAQDLPGYLAVVARLEEALRFLADNCGLAAQWLADIVQYLGDRRLADPRFVADIAQALDKIRRSPDAAGDGLDAGLLNAALDVLEAEFCRLLAEHSAPLAMQESSSKPAPITPPRIPAAAVQKLSLTLDRLAANGRLGYCAAAYADARGDTVSASLRALGLDYLRDPTADAQVLSPSVELWGRHLEFAVRHLLEAERKLCVAVFSAFSRKKIELWSR